MNAVEIEQALSELVEQKFDPAEFPFQFLAAIGNKETTLQRLRKGDSNASDVPGAVLQRNHIHLTVTEPGHVGKAIEVLRSSPKTTQAKAKFLLATDGITLEAEELGTGETIACEFSTFPDHFGFFLPLAGISTIKEIKDNPIDVRATGRLNKLYVELLRENPEWATEVRRPDMNHFMARLIFCFFAEDTDIFPGASLFTSTVDRMSERDGTNVHEVLSTIFRALNSRIPERQEAGLPRWTIELPYVNGGLFSGSTDVPRFTRTARAYLYQAGQLNWKEINPDIFGSMIQAVADDEERGALGMHYTSVPNILKVLNPLFLDDLRAQLDAAADNKIKLLNLRKRMSRIRVFDPACGSGNFLVIAYKQMREIEAEINRRRGEAEQPSDIPINNFRGIELRDFPAEIARLALIIAEFQCDVLYRGQKEALKDVLPLGGQNWITCGNALRLDWLAICPPTGTGVKLLGDDLFSTPVKQAEIEFENEGGETYICGNPPYKGNADQAKEQKDDLKHCFLETSFNWKSLDYICGWFWKAMRFTAATKSRFAFVSTNSICQGQSISYFWKPAQEDGVHIDFAVRSFRWKNLAAENATVTVVIVGCSRDSARPSWIIEDDVKRSVDHVNAYLVAGNDVFVEKATKPISRLARMHKGNYYGLSEGLLLSMEERGQLERSGLPSAFIRTFKGGAELVRGTQRYCLWFPDPTLPKEAAQNELVQARIESVRASRLGSPDAGAIKMAATPHQFREMNASSRWTIAIPNVSSESRPYLPVTLESADVVFPNTAFALFDAELYYFALAASKLHLIWAIAVCGKLETRIRYSNALGWNTFPVPDLTEQNKADLIATAKAILLAREHHFPTTIAELYDVKEGISQMPDNLRRAHEQNDEVLERIYIGRRFKNDTERLEKLFELYTKMTAGRAETKRGKTK